MIAAAIRIRTGRPTPRRSSRGWRPIPRALARRPTPEVAAPTGPLIVTATLGRADFAWADGLRRAHFLPERNVVPAHVSLFHHLPPARLEELDALVRELTRDAAPAATLEAPRSLGRGVAFDVRAPDLIALRDVIAERFARDLIPQDRARPRLHITVQNKVDGETARATLRLLADGFAPRPLVIAGIAIWEYCGGPWRALAEHRFRRPAA